MWDHAPWRRSFDISYLIKVDYDVGTPVSPDDLNLRGDIIQAQLPGAFEAMGVGVLGANDLLAGASDVAPGGAIIRNEAGRPTYVRVPDALPIPARGVDEFLHLVLRVPEFEDTSGTNSARGAVPILRVSADGEEPDALLLAQWDGTKWVDRRPKSALALLSQLQGDIGYDTAARVKGSIKTRLDKLETPLDPANPDAGVTPAQFKALSDMVAAQQVEIDALQAALQATENAADIFPAPFDLLADQIMINATGLTEVNPPSVERGQVSVITATAGLSQNDTPNYSPDTGGVGQLVFDPATGTFGGDV